MKLNARVKQAIRNRLPNWKYQKNTYSQAGEDAIVRFIFEELLFIQNPSYVDIGAYHPYHLSNTAIFHQNGSWGITVEPNPQQHKLFTQHRKAAINLNCGIGPQEGAITYYSLKHPTLNTFIKEEALKYKDDIIAEISIEVFKLSTILAKHAKGRTIDFMSLDVEGLDEAIIQSINFADFRPKVMCIETVENDGNKQWRRINSMIDYIKMQGYTHYADTCINSIFIDATLFPIQLS